MLFIFEPSISDAWSFITVFFLLD